MMTLAHNGSRAMLNFAKHLCTKRSFLLIGFLQYQYCILNLARKAVLGPAQSDRGRGVHAAGKKLGSRSSNGFSHEPFIDTKTIFTYSSIAST